MHRAVAEQVDQLIEWDRAVRADAWDSVHQMRVTTRKIRSLLQSSRDEFGISDDAWILDELRQLAAILGVARDAEVLAERYEQALDELPDELIRGPVRKRLVDGAKRRYQAGLRRSLIAMRSQRYFRLLDALDGLVAAEPAVRQDEEERGQATIGAAYKRVRKAAKAAAAAEADDDKRRSAAPNPQGRQASSLHRRSDRRREGVGSGEDHSDRCSATIRTAWSAGLTSVNRPRSRTRPAKTRSPTACCTGWRTNWPQRSREQFDDALKKLAKAVRKAR